MYPRSPLSRHHDLFGVRRLGAAFTIDRLPRLDLNRDTSSAGVSPAVSPTPLYITTTQLKCKNPAPPLDFSPIL